MPTIIHTADIHLDSPLRNLPAYEGAPVEAIRGAARKAFDGLIEEAVSRPADLLLISGDLYDGDWQDYNTGLYFAARMARLREAGIPVCIIAGNHDAESRMSRTLRLPDNVHILPADRPGTVLLEKIGVAVHGQGFSAPAVKNNLAARYPDALPGVVNIGMLHTCATGREGHEPYAPCSLDDLRARGYQYWALGHVHQREVLCENPPVIFPGNIQGRHIRETGPKGCMIVTTADGYVSAALFHRLDRIRWERIDVDVRDAADAHDAVGAACDETLRLLEENSGLPMAVRIALSGRSAVHDPLSADPERWLNQLRLDLLDAGGGAVWVESMEIRTASPADMEIIEDSPIGELLTLADGIASDPSLMAEMDGVMAELFKKLPKEVRDALAGPADDPHAWLAETARGVRPMLLGRLLGRGRPR
ncbi:exonuclease SbcCD subunit D [Desulfococcus sp.]|uniref:metallophosphoesterase family protein n=1 Tax=Desulfococcus sp. TaxID=2025834 RepID=UPI0035932242